MNRADVPSNPDAEGFRRFENLCVVYVACKQLLLSEGFSPTHGLEPGIDYLEVSSPKVLEWTIEGLQHQAGVLTATQVRGRRKAEQFRASRVYPRLIADLVADVRALGRGR